MAQHAFGEIYGSANPGFRDSVTEERTTNGHFVTLTYESRFARGRAAEEFVWQIQSGQPSLIGYHVNSPLLVTD